MTNFNPSAACYCLGLRVKKKTEVEVGSLGVIECPVGWLYYVGRATGGWPGRIKRFSRENQTNFWHIDYLVNAEGIELKALLPVDLTADSECELAACLDSQPGIEPLPASFGASDCTAGCAAHGWQGTMKPGQLFAKLKEDLPLENWLEFSRDRCTLREVH